MKKTLICAALIAVAFAGPARAELSAQELLEMYVSPYEPTKQGAMFFLSGMANGIGWANGDLVGSLRASHAKDAEKFMRWRLANIASILTTD
jgi:hypothetical protein